MFLENNESFKVGLVSGTQCSCAITKGMDRLENNTECVMRV